MPGVYPIRLAEVTSTQDLARGMPIGSVVVADVQTGGRGRLGRAWEAPAGSALLASFVVAPHPLASLTAGVAAAEACAAPVRLKWPNDLLLEGRKLGGILVEAARDRVVIGVGINLTWAPRGAAMLGSGREPLLGRLQELLPDWLSRPHDQVLERWRELSDTLGRRVRVELGAGAVTGIAEALRSDGALIVAGRPVTVGDVVHLREGAEGP